jgi:hypothetical protein
VLHEAVSILTIRETPVNLTVILCFLSDACELTYIIVRKKCNIYAVNVGWLSVVSTATCYGLREPGTESQWVARLSTPVQNGPGAHPASYTMVTRFSQGYSGQGHGIDQPPPCSAEVKKEYSYTSTPHGPSW